MTDPTGGTISNITLSMLKRVAMAARTSPQAVASAVEAIAAELGTGTAQVVRGIAVSMGSNSPQVAGYAATATTAVEGSMASGALVTSSEVVAATAAPAAAGGIFTWFTGLGVAAQVAVVVGAVVLTAAVAQGVGSLSGDDPTAVAGSGPETTLRSGPGVSVFSEGFKAVAVSFDGKVRIVSVRGTTELEAGIPPCEIRHGGVDCDSKANITDLDSTVYDDATKATTALCALLDGPRWSPPLADGWNVMFGGEVVTLDDWGQVDFGECDAQLGPPG